MRPLALHKRNRRARLPDPPEWDGVAYYTERGRLLPIEPELQQIRQLSDMIDQAPKEWRLLIYEYGSAAMDLYERSVPVFMIMPRITPQDAERILKEHREKRQRARL